MVLPVPQDNIPITQEQLDKAECPVCGEVIKLEYDLNANGQDSISKIYCTSCSWEN